MSDFVKEIGESVDQIKSTLGELRTAADQNAEHIKSFGQQSGDYAEKMARIEADNARMLGAITDMQRKAALSSQVADTAEAVEPHIKSAFRKLMAKGAGAALSDLEQKALSVLSSPDGGYLVPRDTSGRIIQKIQLASPVRRYASVQMISTDALEGLYDNEDVGAGWVGETDSRPTTATGQLGKYRIQAHEMCAAPLITQQLIDDAAVDVEAWLTGKLVARFGRLESDAFINGNGVGKPKGILAETLSLLADPSRPWQQLQKVKTGVNGGFAVAPNSGDALIDLVTSLHASKTGGAIFAMNRFTLAAVMKLKDSDGKYMWLPDFTRGQAGTLLGYPVDVGFDHLPNISTGSASIIFGNFAGYQIVDRQGIRVTPDPFTKKPYVELYSTKRVGGQVTDFEAFKVLTFEA